MQIELVGSFAIFLLYSLAADRWLRILVAILAVCLLPGYYLLFAAGCLLFELFELHGPAGDRISIPIELTALALLLLGIVAGGFPASGDHTGISSQWHRWLSDSDSALGWHIVGAILVLIAVQQSALLRAAFGGRAMQFLGRLSFPIYLIQIPLFCSVTALLLLKLQLHTYSMTAAVTIAATTLIMVPLAWLTYRLIEAPSVHASRTIGMIIDRGDRTAQEKPRDRVEDDGVLYRGWPEGDVEEPEFNLNSVRRCWLIFRTRSFPAWHGGGHSLARCALFRDPPLETLPVDDIKIGKESEGEASPACPRPRAKKEIVPVVSTR